MEIKGYVVEIKAFPKIWHVGSKEVAKLFLSSVEITEKVDGSQFAFGKISGQLVMRSKGRIIHPGSEDKLFKPIVNYVLSIESLLPEDTVYYGETLATPKHNTINYARVPKNHFALFGVYDVVKDRFISDHSMLTIESVRLGVDVVPLLVSGNITELEELTKLLDKESFLGGEKIEGFVIKNYNEEAYSRFSTECFAKYVREDFKERNGATHPSKKDSLLTFLGQFKNENRWKKAIQHLREAGKLTDSPKDIGPLIVEIQNDLLIEEESSIKEALFEMFKRQIKGVAVNGFPEYYKEQLLKGALDAQQELPTGSEIRTGVDAEVQA